MFPMKLAYKPDPFSASDHKLNPQMLQVVVPGDHIIPEFTPVSIQGEIGSCVANAVCDGLEILLGLEDPDAVVQISRLHLYWICRMFDGTRDIDEGTYSRTALRQASKVGVCAEDIWPYENVETKMFDPPPLEATIRASENKIKGYARADKLDSETELQFLEKLANTIRSNKPIVFGTDVGKNWANPSPSAVLTPPSDILGGHATLLTGVRKVAGRYQFLDRNSWGPYWGNHGHIWLDQSYMTWANTRDIWALTRAEPLA